MDQDKLVLTIRASKHHIVAIKPCLFFQYEFLLPLETSCPEFTVFFVVYATRFMPINRPMATVFASYINRNPGYFLKGFRDSPHLADTFRQEVSSLHIVALFFSSEVFRCLRKC